MSYKKILNKENIENITATNENLLVEFDKNGLFLAGNENAADFKKRMQLLLDNLQKVDTGIVKNDDYEIFDGITASKNDIIPDSIMNEAGETTSKLFNFSATWVPGFFLSKSLGFMWGGCAAYFPESGLSMFLIRKNFKDNEKFFIYKRTELLSHELCHAARLPLNDSAYEEHFAYMTSKSKLRQYFGNCFQGRWDAHLFLGPVLLLLAVQIFRTFIAPSSDVMIAPFWFLITIYPIYMLLRSHKQRKEYYNAFKNLSALAVNEPKAVLFRSVKDEISRMALLKDKALLNFITYKCKESLRWRIISKRFIATANQESGE
ncbi:hypothetical protein AAEX28_11320 [Lentisphaerota bacterium WC36G]|nr:hypothetical protein LJT99_14155 [Lentisphaerae bacterium WC36]